MLKELFTLFQQEGWGGGVDEGLARSRRQAIYTGFIILIALDIICLWRLAVMFSAVLRFRLWAVRWRHLICWCWGDDGEISALMAGSPSHLPSRNLQRKLVFHAVIFLAVNMSIPAWAYLFSACYRGACTLSLPPLLYYLQLAAEPLLYVAIALVLDMWLMVADFSPDRHIRAWRVTVLLSSLGFFGLLGYVIIQEREARDALEVSASLSCRIYVLYGAAVLLLLAISFLISGCMIQRRIVNVFSVPGPSARFAWINVMALARLNLVTLICLVSFVLRSLDLAYLIYHHQDYHQRLIKAGKLMLYLRWLADILPILVLLYIMRGTGDAEAMRRFRRYESVGMADAEKPAANHGGGRRHSSSMEDGRLQGGSAARSYS